MTRIPAALRVAGPRAAYLVLGGALLLPFGVLASLIAALAPDVGAAAVADGAVLVLVTGLALPAFGMLHPVQQLELTAARELLPTPPLPPAPRLGTARRRVAAWFTVHVLAGAIGSCLLVSLALLPVLIVQELGSDIDLGGPVRPGPDWAQPGGRQAAWVGLLLTGWLLAPVVVLLLGRALAARAPRVLGPSAQEQMVLLQAQAADLAQRQRLAREVHDSVGHALSVVTLQAAAARHVFEADPEFARTALEAVEETARAALEELDHVLGLLAGDAAGGTGGREAVPGPEPSLADLEALLARTRLTGVEVIARVDEAVVRTAGGPSPDVSREAFRIVQEGVTNAVRHGAGSPVHLSIRDDAGWLAISVRNPLAGPGRAGVVSGRRGLAGIRRRVAALGGSVECGPQGEDWLLDVRLPRTRAAEVAQR